MMRTGRIRLAAAGAAAVLAIAGGTAAYAASGAGGTSHAGPRPVAAYSCEKPGHVVVSLLSTPSSSCPPGTTSVVLGAQGPAGAKGDPGQQGIQGVQGTAAAPAFGVAEVMIDRPGKDDAAWATYSAPLLGSPAGDQAQGAFRFTCPASATASCALSLMAHATAAGWQVYPRVLIMRQVAGSGPEVYCEYGDGVNNNPDPGALTTSDATVTLGIGGSLDCGAGQAYPAGGIASAIEVPNDGSHYDVYTTLVFTKG